MEAWTVRGVQRQQLLDQLKRSLFRVEEEHGREEIDFALARVMLNFLEKPGSEQAEGPANAFFVQQVLPVVQAFARTTEERDVLLATVTEYVVQAAVSKFHSALRHQEIINPETVFGAPSAMTEV